MNLKPSFINFVTFIAGFMALCSIAPAQMGVELVYYELNKPGRDLNPVTADDIRVIRMNELMFDALYGWDGHGEAVPQMAQNLPTILYDSTAVIILKSNLMWPDSAAVTVDDIIFTFKLRHQFPKMRDSRRGLELIEDVRAGGAPNSVVFKFKRKVNHPERLLANIFILPKHKIQNKNDLQKFSEMPVGMGPYRLNDISIAANSYYFGKNPNYVTVSPGRPYVDRVKMNYWLSKVAWIPNILQGGVVDVLPDMEYNTELSNSPQINMRPVNTNTVAMILFNMRDPILRSKEVRQGLQHAISRNEIYDVIYSGDSTNVLTGPYAPSSPFCNYNVPSWNYDTSLSRNLFERSGLLTFDGSKIRRKDNDQQWQITIMTYITAAGEQDNLRKALESINRFFLSGGIDSRLEYRSAEGYLNALEKREFQLIYLQFTADDNFDIEPLFSTNAIRRRGGLKNYSHYSNADVDEAFDDLVLATVPQKQRARGYKIHRLMHDDPPAMFLWNLQKYAYFRSEMQDISIDPFYFFSTVDQWIKSPE